MTLATALFSSGTGSKASPDEKSPVLIHCITAHTSRLSFAFGPPFSASIASCSCWLSSQMLCSMELLVKLKVRSTVMAKRRCLLHTAPLLKKRPAEECEAPKTLLSWEPQCFFTGCCIQAASFSVDLSFQSKSWWPSDCKDGQQSYQPASPRSPSPSSNPKQTLFCAFPGECRTHSHTHLQAENAKFKNACFIVLCAQHVTVTNEAVESSTVTEAGSMHCFSTENISTTQKWSMFGAARNLIQQPGLKSLNVSEISLFISTAHKWE